MKLSRLIPLLLFFLLLLFAFTVLNNKTEKSSYNNNTPLFENLTPESIEAITIEDSEKSVQLTLKDEQWIVENNWAYPADFKKIHELVFSIYQLKPSQRVTGNKEHFKRLGVLAPSENEESVLVTFKDSNKKQILQIVLGKKRESAKSKAAESGQYIRLADKNDVYIIKQSMDLSSDSREWLNKQLIDVEESSIKAITIEHQDKKEKIALSRKSKDDDLELNNLGEDGKLKKYALNPIIRALSKLTFNDVHPATEKKVKDIPFITTYGAELFNGTSYKIVVGEEDDNSYIKIAVNYTEPAPEAEENKEEEVTEKEKSKTVSPKEIAATVESESKYFASWIYTIPSYTKDNLTKKRSELLE